MKNKPKEELTKFDPAGALNDARKMVGQLQEQAKDGAIDGALLDQLQSMLDVTVDTATDAQSQGQSAMDSVSKSDDPATTEPTSEEPSATEPSATEPEEESTEPEEESSDEEPPTEEDETSMTTEKVEQPVNGKPPRGVNLQFDHVEDRKVKLPEFIKALSSGSIKNAQAIAGGDNAVFDEMFRLSQLSILSEGGWTIDNLEKLSGMAQAMPQSLAKGITASTVPGIYLIKLAKLMLPLYAGLVNRLPADSPKDMSSDQATWKAQLGYGAIGWSNFFRAAEASIGVNPPTSFLTYNAKFNDLPVNDSVTMKAIATGRGYSDPMQISVIKSMSALLSAQEKVVLGGTAGSIAAPGTITGTAGSAGGTLSNSGSAGTYYVAVTALTYEGWLAQSKGGSAAVGESTATLSSQVTTGTGSTNSIAVTFDAVEGAVAYNIYLADQGTAGSTAKYNKTVTINSATVTAESTATTTVPSADTTANEYGIEGLLSWCLRSTVYGNATPDKITPIDCAGAGLTTGNGGIVEFDQLLSSQWTTWKIAPSLMVMSPNMNSTLVGKLLALGGAGGFYRVDVTNDRNKVNGGMMVTGYVNKFAPYADGTPRMIDVIPHPDMPDGTIAFLAETIPYPMGNETRAFVRNVLIPYTYFPLPSQVAGVNKIQYNYSITTSEVVECFNPAPQTALVGVDYTK